MRVESNNWIVLIIVCLSISEVSCVTDVLASAATIELIMHSEDNVRTSKYVRGVYTTMGAVMKVEGNLDQVYTSR